MERKEPFYDKIEKFVITVLFIAMLIILTATIFTRFVLSYTFSWAEQMTRLMLVWISFAGISWAGRLDVHMKVTAISLATKKHPRIYEGFLMFGDLVAVIYGFYLSYRIGVAMNVVLAQGQVFSAMTWCPKWIMYLAGVLGMAGFSLRIIQRRIGYFRALKKGGNKA